MYFEKKDIELTNEIIKEIVRVANEVFGGGIYVPCEHHISGYDFLDFNMIDSFDEEYNELNYVFDLNDISNGIYNNHPYENKTLNEILKITKCKFEFE